MALARTSELLQAASANVLRFKTDDALPPELAQAARITGRIVQLKASDAGAIERQLGALRAAGVHVEDLEIGRADLEDVFVEIMREDAALPRTAAPADRAAAARGEAA